MASVDQTAIKRFKRFSQTVTQLVEDNTIPPETLPQSFTDISSLVLEAEVKILCKVKIILTKTYIFLITFSLCKNTQRGSTV